MPVLTALALAVSPLGTPLQNDSYKTPLPVGSGLSLTTDGATQDGASACDSGASPDVWFVYTPAASGNLRTEAIRSGSSPFDTVLSVHAIGQESSPIACNDDFPPLNNSRVEVAVTAGVPVLIRIAGKDGATGSVSLTLSGPPAIAGPNASLQDAKRVGPGLHLGRNRAVLGPAGCISSTEDSWFLYEPAWSGTLAIDTCILGTTFNTSVEIFENGVSVRCANDDGCRPGETFTHPVVYGSRYVIRLGAVHVSGGQYGLLLSGPDARQEECADAPSIELGRHVLDLIGAQPSASASCGSAGDVDWYFTYHAVADGTLNVSTCATTTTEGQGYFAEPSVSLHSGCPADASTRLDCVQPSPTACSPTSQAELAASSSTPVTAGQDVLIRVSSPPDAQLDSILLDIDFTSAVQFCFGDTPAASCPCGNVGSLNHGCENGVGTGGARLYATGTASLASDTITLVSDDAPATTTVVFFRSLGTTAAAPFADGILCVGPGVQRLAGRRSVGGRAELGFVRGESISALGGETVGSVFYQTYYRNAGPFCTPTQANLGNALTLQWTP